MRIFIQLFGKLIAPAATRFYHALKNPELTQHNLQKELFQRFTKSEYGKSLGITSLSNWRHIPIIEYQNIESWIHKQKQPQKSLLTPETIIFYEKTSGSRSAAKLIPYTKSLRRSFNHMFCVWAHDLIINGPKFSTGKVYFCISPQLTPQQASQGSQNINFHPKRSEESLCHSKRREESWLSLSSLRCYPAGKAPLYVPQHDMIVPNLDTHTQQTDINTLEDDSKYLDSWLRAILSPFFISPPGIQHTRNAKEFKHKLSQALLLAENLEIISIWSPSFLKVILDHIQSHHQQLACELKTKISAERYNLLLEAPECSQLYSKLWRQLKLISCWDSASAADGADMLRKLFPGVLVQGKGLLATEAPMTIPLIGAHGCVPMLDEVFFEFEDEKGNIHLLHELKQKEVYEMIISQKGGLYRYRIKDRVRVTHFYYHTPCLEFIGRTEEISDLVGEKLHSQFVRQVLDNLPLAETSFKTFIPTYSPTRYILLLDNANTSIDELAQQLDMLLQESPQYRHARLLGQLAPPEVIVNPRVAEILSLHKTRQGKKWGDLKHDILCTAPIDTELLNEFSC